MLFRYAFAIAFFCLWTGIHSQAPNYVKTDIIFSADSTDSIQTSTVYSDGLGRQIQSQVKLAPLKSLVTGVAFDDAGRPCTTTVPFTIADTNYVTTSAISTAKNNRGNNYAYSVIKYKPDALNRPDSAASPDTAFSLAGTHFSRSWYTGTRYPFSGSNSNIDNTGFILESKLSNTNLDALEPTGLGTDNPTHYLTVSKGPNDSSYTQEIKDILGRTVSTCSMLGIRSEYKYDVNGNLIQENPPDAAISRAVDITMATKYQYSTKSLLGFKITPDADTVKYRYDINNRIRFVQTAKQRLQTPAQTEYIVYLYDSLDRNIAIGINKTQPAFLTANPNALLSLNDINVRIQRIYDDTGRIYGVLGISGTNLGMNNKKGKLLAEINYLADNIGPTIPGFFDNITVDLYSYDEDGNIIMRQSRKPRMKDFTGTIFSYDLQGNPIFQGYCGNTRSVLMGLNRDKQGRLQKLSAGGYPLIPILQYSYDDFGRLSSKRFGNNLNVSAPIDTLGWSYNLRNCPTSITSKNQIFAENNIFYNTAGSPQYNGNISAATYSYNNVALTVSYNYDKVNRLVNVSAQQNGNNFTNENFAYQANGRISSKQRGTDPTGTYNYNSGTNQLNSISNHQTKSTANNYLYDPNGNMILDFSKKMVVVYDWRDMPVSFKFYDQIPPYILNLVFAWIKLEQRITANGGVLKAEVKMVYDAQGNRVLKQEYKY